MKRVKSYIVCLERLKVPASRTYSKLAAYHSAKKHKRMFRKKTVEIKWSYKIIEKKYENTYDLFRRW